MMNHSLSWWYGITCRHEQYVTFQIKSYSLRLHEKQISKEESSIVQFCPGVGETSKADDSDDDDDSEVNSGFGAWLKDNVSSEFVGDPVQVDEGKFEYPPANNGMQVRVEKGVSCGSELQV